MADGNNGEQGAGPASAGVWAAGALSASELERLAAEIRPAWEVGLDEAGEGSSIVAAIPTSGAVSAGSFSAPATAMTAMLGSLGGLGGPSAKVTLSGVMPAPTSDGLPSVVLAPDLASSATPLSAPTPNAGTTAALPLSRVSASSPAPAMQGAAPAAATVDEVAAPWERTGRFAAVTTAAPPVARSGVPTWVLIAGAVGAMAIFAVVGFLAFGAGRTEGPSSSEPTLTAPSVPTVDPNAATQLAPLVVPTAPAVLPTVAPAMASSLPPIVPPGLIAPPTVAAVPVMPSATASAVPDPTGTPSVLPVVTAAPVVVSAAPLMPSVVPPVLTPPAESTAGRVAPRATPSARPAAPRPPTNRPRPTPRGAGFTTESPY